MIGMDTARSMEVGATTQWRNAGMHGSDRARRRG